MSSVLISTTQDVVALGMNKILDLAIPDATVIYKDAELYCDKIKLFFDRKTKHLEKIELFITSNHIMERIAVVLTDMVEIDSEARQIKIY